MAAQSRNEGFHVLDEFVCEAVHAPSIRLADRANQGRNEGMSVMEELVCDEGKKTASKEGEEPDNKSPLHHAELENAIKSEAERLAAFISASADPIGIATLFQKLLLDKLASIQRSAVENHRKGSYLP